MAAHTPRTEPGKAPRSQTFGLQHCENPSLCGLRPNVHSARQQEPFLNSHKPQSPMTARGSPIQRSRFSARVPWPPWAQPEGRVWLHSPRPSGLVGCHLFCRSPCSVPSLLGRRTRPDPIPGYQFCCGTAETGDLQPKGLSMGGC